MFIFIQTTLKTHAHHLKSDRDTESLLEFLYQLHAL